MEDLEVDSCGLAPRNYDKQEESSSLVHTQTTEPKPMEWTNEKHSLYLKSMEATFVDELYNSFDFFGQNIQKNCPRAPTHKQTSTHVPSSQFKVLCDGCWSKIDFRREKAEINQAESGGLLENPWIQHYRSPKRQATRKCSTSTAKDYLPTTVNQYPANNSQVWRPNPVGSDIEVTDQNFNVEDLEEEKSGRMHETKRGRISSDAAPNNDQVVPFEGIVQVDDDATEEHLHPEN